MSDDELKVAMVTLAADRSRREQECLKAIEKALIENRCTWCAVQEWVNGAPQPMRLVVKAVD